MHRENNFGIAVLPDPFHRSRNGGEGQGGACPPPPPPPQYINQGGGGPGPPNVGAIKGILTVKMDFLVHIPAIFATIFGGSSTKQ